jgi:hypothetical protein
MDNLTITLVIGVAGTLGSAVDWSLFCSKSKKVTLSGAVVFGAIVDCKKNTFATWKY